MIPDSALTTKAEANMLATAVLYIDPVGVGGQYPRMSLHSYETHLIETTSVSSVNLSTCEFAIPMWEATYRSRLAFNKVAWDKYWRCARRANQTTALGKA